MKKLFYRLISIILCVVLTAMSAFAVAPVEQTVNAASAGLSAMGGKKGQLLSDSDFAAGTSMCDWSAIALALSGSEEDYENYCNELQKYVEEEYSKNGGLDSVKSTTYHRISLAALALGSNPQSFGTKTDGTAINLIADGTYSFAGDSVGMQGLNGWIYALISLDASNAEVPQDAKFTREDMINAIVNAQEEDGGFGLIEGKSDIDITAMALQALAPYRKQYAETVENAVTYLSKKMSDNCTFVAYGDASVESSAQVILALCALGIDPEADTRFSRGSNNVLQALEYFVQADGTYSHLADETQGDYLATAQTLLALTAVRNLRNGDGWIFNFTNYTGPIQNKTSILPLAVPAIAFIALVAVVIVKKRRK